MSFRRVRIYTGNPGESDVIGFSASASDAPDNPRFSEFMEQRDYMCTKIGRLAGGVSYRYVEVRPPMSTQDIKDFGMLCVGSCIDGVYSEPIVDPYHDGTLVLDNRGDSSVRPYAGGILITEG